MTDTLSTRERSERMRSIKSKNTKPELVVRKLCREVGCVGYRLHRKDVLGKPDLAYLGRKLAIFVHGCFWHGHDCHGYVRKPKTRTDYWIPKIEKNIARDAEIIKTLEEQGWHTLIVWECETKHPALLRTKLSEFMSSRD